MFLAPIINSTCTTAKVNKTGERAFKYKHIENK